MPKQPGAVTAGMIEADGDVEILERMSISPPSAKAGAQHGDAAEARPRYVPDKNFDSDLGSAFIPVDSVHSPVRKVNSLWIAARLDRSPTTTTDAGSLDEWLCAARDSIGLAAKRSRTT